MKKKTLPIIIIVIIVILMLAAAIGLFYSNSGKNKKDDDNKTVAIDELKGEKIAINGLACMIPDAYKNGTIKKSPGIETYGTYANDKIYITVYDKSNKGNEVYQGDIDYFAYGIANDDDKPKIENITLDDNKILYVIQHSDTRGDYRLAFFEVNGKRVLIEWLGGEITPDIKNIIYSFYKLNNS